MSESVDIKDRESLEAWLKDQPREVAVWIAFRASARTLPFYWKLALDKRQIKTETVDVNLNILFRVLVTSSIFSSSTSRTVMQGASLTYAAAFEAPNNMSPFTGLSATVLAAFNDDPVFARKNAAGVVDVMTGKFEQASDLWDAVRADAGLRQSDSAPNALRLWPVGNFPYADETWLSVKRQLFDKTSTSDWQFWIEWYDALLDGRPMLGDAARTWEMLEQIALIEPATWDKGPEVVNPVIREIWELHRLRAEVAALQVEKTAFLAARASEVQRGHNQPPEGLVDDAPEVARQITIIWDGLDEAREELERDAPDKGVLRAIAERMLAALNAVVAYCGKVADAVVISAAKIGGGAVGTAVLDHVANNGRLMQFAKELLVFGGG